MHRRTKMNASLLIIGCCVFLFTAVQFVAAAPKAVPNAKAGDCGACHGKEKVIPNGHTDTKAANWETCQSCHKEANMTLAGKVPLSHVHQLAGVTCVRCHGNTKKPQAVSMDKCVSCHDPAKLTDKTANVKPENPHNSPHWGPNMDCTVCHHQHAKSESYCNYCHMFDFKVP